MMTENTSYKNKYAALLPFGCFFVLLFVIYLPVRISFSDDAGLMAAVQESGAWQFAWAYRQNWSSRLIIELVYFHMYQLPLVVWKLLNSAVMVLAAYSVSRLVGTLGSGRANLLACATVSMYPVTEMINGGWISAGHNYMLVVALGLYAITPWHTLWQGRAVKWYSWPLSLLALLYAANNELMLALMCGALAVYAVAMVLHRKRPHIYQLAAVLVLAIDVLVLLSSPGNGVRSETEVRLYYPDYGSTSIIIRGYNCFMLVSQRFLGTASISTLVLSALVAYTVYDQYKEGLYRFIALVPLAVSLALGALYPVFVQVFPALERVNGMQVDHYTAGDVTAYISLVLFVVTWVCLLIGIFLSFGGGSKGLIFCIVLLAGMLSQLVMAMAPSIYVSAPRFYIYLHFALLVTAFALLRKETEQQGKASALLQKGYLAAAGYAVLNFVLSL